MSARASASTCLMSAPSSGGSGAAGVAVVAAAGVAVVAAAGVAEPGAAGVAGPARGVAEPGAAGVAELDAAAGAAAVDSGS